MWWAAPAPGNENVRCSVETAKRHAVFCSVKCRYWPGAAFVARTDLVAIGGKADATGSRANDAIDPQRHFAPVNCRTAKGLFDHLVGARDYRYQSPAHAADHGCRAAAVLNYHVEAEAPREQVFPEFLDNDGNRVDPAEVDTAESYPLFGYLLTRNVARALAQMAV
jgi:hypothetical protein